MKFLFILYFVLFCNISCSPKKGTWTLVHCGGYKCTEENNFPTKEGCEGARDAGNKAAQLGQTALQYSCSEEK